jgi:hypothetical protein
MDLNYLLHRSWYYIFLIFISGCGVAAMGAYYMQDEGQLITSDIIEIYKNMPEDSPSLISVREQAAKDPEGFLAAALKCAGKLSTQPNLATPPNAKESNIDKINNTEKKECYWKPPLIAPMTQFKSNPFTDQQESMTASLRGALINLGKSQERMAKAMGLDEQAMAAGKMVKGLESGDLGAKDDIEKTIETATSVQDAIDKETAKKKILDIESKKVFITSIPFYIKGVINSIQTGTEAASISTSLFSLNPAALLQVGALLTIVTNLPDLVSQLAGSTGKIMDFMTANEIDNSEMKDQLSDVF